MRVKFSTVHLTVVLRRRNQAGRDWTVGGFQGECDTIASARRTAGICWLTIMLFEDQGTAWLMVAMAQ